MIQLATALPAISVGPVKPNAAISVDVSGFALALGALMPKIAAPSAGPQGKPADAAVPLPEGQEIAEGGKELPDAVLGLDGKSEEQPGAETDTKEEPSAEDAPPPFAWFATTPAPTAEPEAKAAAPEVASPAVIPEAGGKPGPDIQLPETEPAQPAPARTEVAAKAEAPAKVVTDISVPATPRAKPQAEAKRTAPVQRQPGTDAAPPVPGAPADPAVEVPVVDAAQPDVATTTTTDKPVRPPLAQPPRELRQAAAEAPVVRITLDKPAAPQKVSIADVTRGERQPAPAPQSVAEQVFAAFEAPRPRAAASPASDPQVDLSTVAAPATGTQTAAAVAAAGQSQDAALDTRHQQWTTQMIDKIEALRDASPVRETKLSLMPEALGKVDISIRQDDAGIHVRFNTDTQAARQLIADAQPKLAEIAEQRGIRLGSTSVESNATGTGAGTGSQMNQGQRQDAQPQRNQPSAPPGARREAQSSNHDDERVA